jgi:prepilin-type N-terminal cleavage/methylation domain-containing protein
MIFGTRYSRAFSLVELLATIAIAAVLIALAMFFTASYVTWARQTTGKEIYTVLNEELSRYKGNGGNIAALTAGAPIADIFAQLKTPVVPSGMPASLAQQFMNSNYT